MAYKDEDGGLTVSSELTRLLLRGVTLGGDALDDLFESAGFDPRALSEARGRIPLRILDHLWRELERASGDPCFGLHLGELPAGLPAGNLVFAAMMNSATVGQALHRFCRYHDLMAEAPAPRLRVEGGRAVLAVADERSGAVLGRHHVECTASLFAGVLRCLLDQPAGPVADMEVRFRHPQPSDVSEHVRVLGHRLRFEQPANEVLFDAELLDWPIPNADEALAGVLDLHADAVLRRVRQRNPMTARVQDALTRALPDGAPDLPAIAARLSMSPRTLQGRLREEGTSFREVLDGLRFELAKAHLDKGTLALSEIAFLLGYGEQSAFTRAFRRWAGCSPTAYRAEARPAAT